MKENLENLKYSIYHIDILYKAIENDDIDTVRSLLSGQMLTTYKRAYLDIAVHKGHVQRDEALALINRAYLDLALYKSSLEIIALLIAHGADINHRDETNCTALHNAVWQWHKELDCEQPEKDPRQVAIVELLLKAGADPNAQANICDCMEGCTPLHVAVYWNKNNKNIDIIRLLLAYGADPTIKDNDGISVIEAASCKEWCKISTCDHDPEEQQLLNSYTQKK